MKKWIYTLSLMGALAVGANADVTKDTDNCYMIGTPSQLLEFAGIVNAATEPLPIRSAYIINAGTVFSFSSTQNFL